MSHTGKVQQRRIRPFWKLAPHERVARGLCLYCGELDPQQDHGIFGCRKAGR